MRLRPSTRADWGALFTVAADPLLWAVHPAHDRWQEPVFRAYFEAGIASGGALTIIDRAGDTVIGSSRFDNWNADADEIEIGWTYLARSHWGGAYNREVKRLMLDHILQYVGTVVFTVGVNNIRSRRAVEKIGGRVRPGTVDRLMAGELKPHVIYEIQRPRTPA
ncbi:GNAT family N-acetyltransferase [Sphingomonas guangdongensis]|uniref:GNAT family N-acetyltransferase n=1 Tax=Sphingomonas guangdongensis TaxID=1141890 RepID=UPI001FE77882|nr:GNAT family N-acetyltransferase [Sphingomonas guangdongensis]